MYVTDHQVDLAAKIIKRHVRGALASGTSIRDAAAEAALDVQQAHGGWESDPKILT